MVLFDLEFSRDLCIRVQYAETGEAVRVEARLSHVNIFAMDTLDHT
jgi:hypothetical protein